MPSEFTTCYFLCPPLAFHIVMQCAVSSRKCISLVLAVPTQVLPKILLSKPRAWKYEGVAAVVTVSTGPVQAPINSDSRSWVTVADWIPYSNSSSTLKADFDCNTVTCIHLRMNHKTFAAPILSFTCPARIQCYLLVSWSGSISWQAQQIQKYL